MAIDISEAVPSEHPKGVMTDKDRFQLIVGDISNSKPLNDIVYNALLSDIEQRQKISASEHHLNSAEKVGPEVAEGVAWTLVNMNTIGSIENIEHVARGLESTLSKLGPIGFFIANGVGLLTTPWRCYKEKRWPTRHEWIKIGLCVMTIALIAVAVATPIIAAWLFIAAAVVGLVKSVQSIQAKKIELHHILDQARLNHAQITTLISEIDDLQKIAKRTDAQQTDYEAKTKELTKMTDQYVREGHSIHRLKEELYHPLKSSLSNVNVAMSAVALIGLVVTVFFPPAGLGLLLGAGLVSLVTLSISAVSKWFVNRNQHLPMTPVVNSPATQHTAEPDKTDRESLSPTPRPSHQLSSTALEIDELNRHPSIEPVASKLAAAPQPHPADPTEAAVILSEELPAPSSPSVIRCEEIERELKSELNAIEHPPEEKKSDDEDDVERKNEGEREH